MFKKIFGKKDAQRDDAQDFVISAPKDVSHGVHVAVDETAEFGFSGLPAPWTQLLRAAGVTKDDLRKIELPDVITVLRNAIAGVVPTRAAPPLLATVKIEDVLSSDLNPAALYTGLVKLDSGASGDVYRATLVADGRAVALKRVRMRNVSAEWPLIRNELLMLHAARHPSIVQLIAAHRISESEVWIVMELMDGGKLTDLIDRFGSFPEPQIAALCRPVLEALAHMHRQGAMHRDIKSVVVF